jgi:hypothetical protein
MQSSLALSSTFVCLLALSACARPTVGSWAREDIEDPTLDAGEEEPDADAPELDAAEPPPVDAGRLGPKPDAGMQQPPSDASACGDRDHDQVCDAEDNCPNDANEGQEDADRDGQGDACEPEAGAQTSPCNADSVPAMVSAGDAQLSNVRVNGMSSHATVKKGQRVSITISYAFGECALPIPGQPRFMVIGLDGRSSGNCQILVEVPCPTPVNADVTLTLDAPTVSGPAYVVALGRQGFACSDSLSNAKRIAALCVE